MKKLVILGLQAFLAAVSYNASAQLNVNVNIGSQPAWGPTGYDHVDYYYLPDIQTYYHVPSRKFIYLNDRRHWIYDNTLPSRYQGYNLYNGYKVVINSPRPYMNFEKHKVKYARYKFNHSHAVRSGGNGQGHYRGKGHYKHMERRNIYRIGGNRMNGQARFNDKGNGHFKEKGHGKH